MRFGVVHRVFLDSLATVGMVALAATGELERKTAIGLFIALMLALAIPSSVRENRQLQIVGSAIPAGALAVQIYRLTTSASLITLAVEFAALLQVVRLGTRRGAAHDQQVILLALLHLIAATVLGAGLAYAVCFIGFLFLAPVTLLLSHLRREVEGNYRQGAKDRAGMPVDVPRILRSRRVVGPAYLLFVISLSAPMFLFTGLLFLAFPRVGLSLLLLQPPRKARMVGFSDHIDLGVVGRLQTDPSVALRLTYSDLPKQPPERLAVYFRGATLDQYDGHAWFREQAALQPADHERSVYPIKRWPDQQLDRSVAVELSPIDPTIVFLPTDAVALQVLPQMRGEGADTVTLYRNADDEYRYATEPTLGLRYRVYLDSMRPACAPPLSPTERIRYLKLPPNVSNRLEKLARSWVGAEMDPLKQAALIERHLRQEYRYDLDSPSGGAANPIEDFLFTTKRGHCEYYATAMAVMLRTLGVPSRDVTGFGAATYNRFGHFYVVRQSDAHSWVEAWSESSGWQRFDPTPAQTSSRPSQYGGAIKLFRDLVEAAAQRWSRHVEAYDMQQQLTIARHVNTQFRQWQLLAHHRVLGGIQCVLAFVLGSYLAFRLWRFLRRQRLTRDIAFDRTAHLGAPARLAIRLYRELEHVMSEYGVARPVGTPPRRWATMLQEFDHPIASDVLALTQLYIEARFGGRVLTETDTVQFEQTLKVLRHMRTRRKAA